MRSTKNWLWNGHATHNPAVEQSTSMRAIQDLCSRSNSADHPSALERLLTRIGLTPTASLCVPHDRQPASAEIQTNPHAVEQNVLRSIDLERRTRIHEPFNIRRASPHHPSCSICQLARRQWLGVHGALPIGPHPSPAAPHSLFCCGLVSASRHV